MVACRGVTKRFGGVRSRSTTSTSTCAPARCTRWWARTGPARARSMKMLDGLPPARRGRAAGGRRGGRASANARDARPPAIAMIPQELDLVPGAHRRREPLRRARARAAPWGGIDWSAIAGGGPRALLARSGVERRPRARRVEQLLDWPSGSSSRSRARSAARRARPDHGRADLLAHRATRLERCSRSSRELRERRRRDRLHLAPPRRRSRARRPGHGAARRAPVGTRRRPSSTPRSSCG